MAVILRESVDEETLDVEVDGERIARFSYGVHGNTGLSAARKLVRGLGVKLGFPVEEVSGSDEP